MQLVEVAQHMYMDWLTKPTRKVRVEHEVMCTVHCVGYNFATRCKILSRCATCSNLYRYCMLQLLIPSILYPYFTGMTKEECVKFVRQTLSHAMARDGSSGGVIRTVCIDKDGVDRGFVPGDKLPFMVTAEESKE